MIAKNSEISPIEPKSWSSRLVNEKREGKSQRLAAAKVLLARLGIPVTGYP
jgi:hypothetical protein